MAGSDIGLLLTRRLSPAIEISNTPTVDWTIANDYQLTLSDSPRAGQGLPLVHEGSVPRNAIREFIRKISWLLLPLSYFLLESEGISMSNPRIRLRREFSFSRV